MDIFARLRRAGSGSSIELARAALTPAIATMMADGNRDPREEQQVMNFFNFSPIFMALDPVTLDDIAGEIIEEIQEGGVQAAIANAAATLPQPLRETAYCFAVRIAMADGHLDEREKTMLTDLSSALEIPVEMAGMIFRVVSILQRGPSARG